MTESREGRSDEPQQLMPAVYDELRRLAAGYLRKERTDHTLQPTALVHEAFLKLHARGIVTGGRTHFLALAATAMRQILVDHARAKAAAKRGGGWKKVTVSEASSLSDDGVEDLLAVNDALVKLAALDSTAARIVEMRFFAGLTEVEIAGELGISDRWVREQWGHARAWLRREMGLGA
ncbi:MAG: ECF-type sigma factor [Candidatus Eisenbacteria bacterium]